MVKLDLPCHLSNDGSYLEGKKGTNVWKEKTIFVIFEKLSMNRLMNRNAIMGSNLLRKAYFGEYVDLQLNIWETKLLDFMYVKENWNFSCIILFIAV